MVFTHLVAEFLGQLYFDDEIIAVVKQNPEAIGP